MAFENDFAPEVDANIPLAEPLSAQTGPVSVPLPREDTDNRAAKAHFALQEKSPGVDVLQNQFASGGENDLRKQMAAEKDVENQQTAVDMIGRVAATDIPLTDQDLNTVYQVVKTKPTDPGTVLENAYAKKFVQFATTASPETNQVFRKGWEYAPGATAFEQTVGQNIIARKHIAVSKLQEIEARWEQTPWFNTEGNPGVKLDPTKGAADAYLLSLIPFVSWAQTHNALKNLKTESILPGNNMAEMVQQAWLLAPDEFKATTDAAIEELWQKNPLAARALAKALVTFSNSDQFLGNAFGVFDVASVLPVGTIVKGSKVAKGLLSSKKVADAIPELGEDVISKSREILSRKPQGPVMNAVSGDTMPSGILGPNSELLSPGVTNAGREIAGRAPEGPVMMAQRGPRMQAVKGETSNIERGVSVDLPPPEMGAVSGAVRDMNIPLVGPTSSSKLPELADYPNREAFLAAWSRYYGRNPDNPNGRYVNLPLHPEMEKPITQQVQRAMVDVVKASGDAKVDPEVTFAWIGDTSSASRFGASRTLAENVGTPSAVITRKELGDLGKGLPSIFHPDLIGVNPVGLTREATQAIVTQMGKRGSAFMASLSQSLGVERLSQASLDRAYTLAERAAKNEFHSASDHILDTVRNARDPRTNTYSVSVQLGNRGGKLFESSDQAALFAKDVFNIQDRDFTIGQRGMGFYVDVARPIDETQASVRDLLIDTKSKNPVGRISDLIFGTWTPRSAADLLSTFQSNNRLVATFAPQAMRKELPEIANDITTLPKKQRQAVQDILRANRDYINPATKERGMFHNTVGEFETAFIDKHKRPPNAAEVQAYFSYVQLSDMDWVLRNMGWLRDKERLGIMNHRFTTREGASPWFEGKSLPEFPTTNPEDSGILVIKDGQSTYHRRFDKDFDESLFKGVKDGEYKLLQVANPTDKPLKSHTDVGDLINYVITKDTEQKRLDWKQASYQPGGHVIYPNEWFVKQGKIAQGRGGRNFYYGDTSIFNFSNEAKASMFAKRMDEARRMLLRDDPALDAFVEKNLPHTSTEFRKLFDDGYLNKEMPISHSYTGRTTIQTDKEFARMAETQNIKNDFQSSHNLYQFLDKNYLADRDMQLGTVTETGNVLKPWQIEEAPALDPYPALNKALGQAIRSRWMTDYKIMAAENWVQQFAPFMNNKEEALRKNPLFTLYHPQWAEGTVAREDLVAAKNAQAAIVNFIGASSELQSNIGRLETMVTSAAYNALGDKGADFVAAHALPMVSDPTKYMRSIAFHSKLGFFNPVQLLVQAQSLSHVIGVAGPMNGLPGMAAGFLMRRLVHTEEQSVIDDIANASRAFGWKPEHFKESYEALKTTGMWNVAGETAWRDDVFDPKIFTSTAGRFLDKGTFFFAEGERAVRMAAWNTAYREWRTANPIAELTNRVTGDILNRADTLSVNMTRASNAAYQKGVLSIPSQFLAFNTRLMEQFLGNRLTKLEKGRALATYSVLYGVPVGLSTMTGFLPLYEDVKKEAMERGINVNDGWYKAFQEGLISMGVTALTGKDYNVAPRFGPGANNVIEDGLIKGNKSALELLSGASGGVIGDMLKTTMPFVSYFSDVVNGRADKFPLMLEDLVHVVAQTENISTLSTATKMWIGANTGRYVSKNERWVGDVTNMDTAMMGFGLTPLPIADAFLKASSLKEVKKYQDEKKIDAMKEFQRGISEFWKGNPENGETHMRRGASILERAGMDPVQRSEVFTQTLRGGSINMVDKLNYDWLRKSPIQQRPARTQEFIDKGKP